MSKSQQLVYLLDQICSLKQFNQIHAHITTSGLENNELLVGKLVQISTNKFSGHNNMSHPMSIFTHAQHKTQLAWNTIIRGFSITPTPLRALSIFMQMCRQSVPPQTFTFAFVFKACAKAQALVPCKQLHSFAFKTRNESHLFVANTAISAYAACGDLGSAHMVFDDIIHRNVVTWNALISGYLHNALPHHALSLFKLMWEHRVRPDDVTIINLLSACAHNEDLHLGKWAHAYVDQHLHEFQSNLYLATALIDMYAKCKQMELARLVFDAIPRRDIGIWNALIAGYVTNRCFTQALHMFHQLQANRFIPDERTLVTTLSACAHLGDLDSGRNIHSYAQDRQFRLNAKLGTALIDMYMKCGCINEAREIFNKMFKRDIITWTSMIGGLAVHGHARDALDLFFLMLDTGPKPDGVTFLAVLSACCHAGLVDEALHCFKSMRHDCRITPTIHHYGCMVDLLGKSGRLDEAYQIICSMDILPNAIVWRALLSACKLHSCAKLAETAVENLFKLQSDNGEDYVLLSNLYASNGRWEDVDHIRRKMVKRGLRKIPGVSYIGTNTQRTETSISDTLYKESGGESAAC